MVPSQSSVDCPSFGDAHFGTPDERGDIRRAVEASPSVTAASPTTSVIVPSSYRVLSLII